MTTHTLLKTVAIVLPTGLIVSAAAAFALSFSNGSVTTQDATEQSASTEKPATRPADDYPLDVCVITGEKLGTMGEPPVKKIDGRTVKFCCAGCIDTFEKDKDKYHAKMDELIIKAKSDSYPLKECPVSGEAIDHEGEPVLLVHRPTNQLIKFCCEGCQMAFKHDPGRYLPKLNAAQEKQDAEKR